jgi:hypothetical protein
MVKQRRPLLLYVKVQYDNVNPNQQNSMVCKATTEADAILITTALNKYSLAVNAERWYTTCK